MLDCFVIILLSLSMFVGCYLSGLIPLSVSLSEEKLNLVTILGAGLLVGTALSVIIPEGVSTLYISEMNSHNREFAQITTKGDDTSKGNAPHEHSHEDPHSIIGISLVLGFIFMLLVDQIGSGSHHHKLQPTDAEGPPVRPQQKITATLGLVVHSAADGIALGAAATTTHAEIELIIFVAIMLHKAPAAFALVTFLMHEGFDRARIRRHLLMFSVAAPLLALITYFTISKSIKESTSTISATGIALLFSAGTFLYVATVHVLPELAMHHHSHGDSPVEGRGWSKRELCLLVTGALLPLLLSFGHHH